MLKPEKDDPKQEICRTDALLPLLMRKRRPIALVGMMGAGKTTVARHLSCILGLKYVDTDLEIERRAGCSIPHYFATHGEAAFRQFEAQVVQDYLSRGSAILALGGGAFIQDDLRVQLLQKAWCVYLDVPLEVLWGRVKQRKSRRPMIAQDDAHRHFADLHVKRVPIYAKALISIECRGESGIDIAQNIKKALWHLLKDQ